MSTRLKNMLGLFIHQNLHDPERRKAEYLVMLSAVVFCATIQTVIADFLRHEYRMVGIDCLVILGIILALLSLRFFGQVTLAVYSLVVFTVAPITLSALSFGGLINANVYWLMVVPLGVALVLDIKHSGVATFLSCAATFVVYVFSPDHMTQLELDKFAEIKSMALQVVNLVIVEALAFATIYRHQVQQMYQKLSDRNQSIENIVNNVQTGFLMIGHDLLVKPGYSRFCLQLFKKDELIGADFLQLVGLIPEQAGVYRFAIQQVFADTLPEDVALSNLPNLVKISENLHISLEGKVIRDGKAAIAALLFTIKDVSDLIKAETESRKNFFLLRNIRNRDGLLSMLRETYEALKNLQDKHIGPQNASSQRLLHTMKGNLASFGLESTAQLVHEIEDRSSIKREDVQQLISTIDEFLECNKDVFGIDHLSQVHDKHFTVSLGQITQLKQLVGRIPGKQEESLQQLSQSINQLATLSVKHLLKPLHDQLDHIAQQIGKAACLDIQGPDIRTGFHLEKIIQHVPNLFRNALYHGIEEQHERNGKPWPAVLSIRLEDRGDRLLIEFADDGRGIDPLKIKARASELMMMPEAVLNTLNSQELIELVFADGLSTEKNVNEISGRGSGMAGFKAEVIGLCGSVQLISQVGLGTKIRIELPKIIEELSLAS